MAAAKKIDPPPFEEGPPQDFTTPGFVVATEHLPIDNAPRDKRWIEASVDGKVWTRVRFYQTRIRTGAIQWIPVECWTTTDPPKFSGKVEGLTMWRPCGQW